MDEENDFKLSEAPAEEAEAGEEPSAEAEAAEELAYEPQAGEETGAEAEAGEESAAEAEAGGDQAAEAEAAAEPAPRPPPRPAGDVDKGPRPVTRARAFWTSAGCGLVVFVLAVAASLGILVGLNGGLHYATPGRLAEVSHQVEGLAAQTALLVQDVAALRTRLDNLSGLSGRIEDVEGATEGLQADVADAQARLEELADVGERVDAVQATAQQLQSDVQILGAEVQSQQAQWDRLQGFLEGLRALVDGLFLEEE